MPVYRVLFIDVGRRETWIKEYDIGEVSGPIELGVKLHLYEYETWRKPAYSPDNALVIGAGLFTGTRLYGSHRLVAVFKSPLTRGLHVAAMGGAAYQLNANIDAFIIQGRSSVPLILKIYDEGDGNVKVDFDEIDELRLLEIWHGYGGEKGIYGFQKYLSDKYSSFYEKYNGRSILVGPAAKYTSLGALASITLVKGKIDYGSEDLAARGGPGSVLYRAHGVAAIVYGGLFDRSKKRPADLTDSRSVNRIFTEIAGKPYITMVIEAGTKYRYNPKLNTGGTLGGNYPTLKIHTPMFNWNMIYPPVEVRERLHKMIMEGIWEPFNKEAIETKSWKTCGEPCPIACKKIRKGRYKSDYEPYEGFGPFIGIFDIHLSEKIVELVDAYGFDAIETGQLVGFLFDALSKDLLYPGELGLPEKPAFDPVSFKAEDSARNARLAEILVENLAWGRVNLLRLIGEKGLRSAAKILDILYADRVERAHWRFSDLLVYASFGEEGHITPNYYWTPGMVAPLAVLGRYWTLYKGVFLEPEEYAEKAFHRAIREMLSDNNGFCRFHRGWVEKTLDKIMEKYYGIKDLDKRYTGVYREIMEYQEKAGSPPSFWDSRKVIDYLARAAEEYGNEQWALKFRADKMKAAREWWIRFHNRIMELLRENAG
jgi:glyceraldehyde-3-phosphate dehydrogenase (ferredoxin)